MAEAKKFRSGFVAIMGRPNVGKSSIMNAFVGEKVAIVSDRPQTTRNRIMGVVSQPDWQVVFVDTPGIHRPRTKLGEYMMKTAEQAMIGTDALLCVVDGRTDDDRGMNTTRLAGIMAEKGCINAYNLDGGGSSTLYWHGKVVNSVNKSGAERDISDCVYFASAWPN